MVERRTLKGAAGSRRSIGPSLGSNKQDLPTVLRPTQDVGLLFLLDALALLVLTLDQQRRLIGLDFRREGPDEVLRRLKRLGITHVLFNATIFKDWRETVFTEEKQHVLRGFFTSYAEVLFTERGYVLARVSALPQ